LDLSAQGKRISTLFSRKSVLWRATTRFFEGKDAATQFSGESKCSFHSAMERHGAHCCIFCLRMPYSFKQYAKCLTMAKKEKNYQEDEAMALLFASLADPIRVRIFRFLRGRCWPATVEDGEETWMAAGPTVGEVCTAVSGSKGITAKVSHHLKEMRLAGLIAVKRRGKNMICGVRREAVERLSDFLADIDTPESRDVMPLPPDENELP